MDQAQLAVLSTEELQRLQKIAHKAAREAPRSSPDAPSDAWARQSKAWGDYCEELKSRGVEPEPLE